MHSVLFGNPNTDSWRLSLIDAAPDEGIEFDGELRTGFFIALTPLSIPSSAIEAFVNELDSLYKSLSGKAALVVSNETSKVSWSLVADVGGHIESSGSYSINGNSLSFRFDTDQTQLSGLLQLMRDALAIYHETRTA